MLATDFAPEVLAEVPLLTVLPDTVTRGLETADDCEPDVFVALLAEPDVDVWAKAAPLNIVNAVAARSKCLTESLLEPFLQRNVNSGNGAMAHVSDFSRDDPWDSEPSQAV